MRSWSMTPGGAGRKDIATPPPQSKRKSEKSGRDYRPPARSADYGLASTAHLTRPQSAVDGPSPGPSLDTAFKFKRRRPRHEP